MITAELLRYIDECKNQGYKFSAIKEFLVIYGWNETDIANAYLQTANLLPRKKHSRSFIASIKPVSKYVVTILLSVSLSMLGAGTYLSLHAQTTQQELINPISNASANSNTTTPIESGTPAIPTQEAIASISATPSPVASISATVGNTPALKKSTYSIALIGDSMIDTMGENMDFLQSSLKAKYPSTTFSLYNYGIGAQNVEQGLDRFAMPFDYKTRHYPALSNLHPDIIIVASFSYNPFSPPDPNKHKELLTQLVEDAKSTGSKVYMLAEIAPLQYNFAKGPNGIADWTDAYRAEHAQEIIDQLHNVLTVAKSEGVGLIDAFGKTEIDGEFGSSLYTNSSDGIHPSSYGQQFTANLIANTIKFD